jgi:hypothetical protein
MIKINFLARKFCVKILFCNDYLLQYAQHFYEKGKGSGSLLVINGSGCGSWRPRIRNTVFCDFISDFTFGSVHDIAFAKKLPYSKEFSSSKGTATMCNKKTRFLYVLLNKILQT